MIKKNEKKKRKKSKLSSDIVIAEDSNSSSEDDEPLTPTSSTIEIPFPESAFLEQHADSNTPKQDLSVKDTSKDDVSTCQSDNKHMQSIQTQSSLPQPSSKVPINSPSPQQKSADHKHRSKVSWLSALFKPKKTISNIFSKKPPQLPKRITPSESPAVVKKQQPTYTRYPLDVERSLYRLSHKKLANPRRPLQQQVVISNMMYWYLSIIRTYHPHLLHKKTRYYTNVCQATYQSFAPPTPGTNFKHQPISHRRLYQNNTALVVEKLNAKKSSHDKKYKHKPVRNTALMLDKNRFT